MAARLVEFEEDAIIMREGVVDPQMYIVVEGTVALYINYGKSDERVLGVCTSNKLFGELGLLAGAPSPYTAVAFSEVKLAYFTKNNLKSFIKGYPDYAIKVLYNIARLNQLLSENLKLSLLEIEGMKAKMSNTEMSNTDVKIQNTGESKISQDIAKNLVRGERSSYHYSFFGS